jgi:putative Mg2+ transporter-C (MgtC) family protein
MFTDFTSSFDMEPGIWAICLRLLCAMLVGMVIGTEREYTRRPAGMRTHILVALGACVVSITGQMLFNEYRAFGATPDPARLSAQVVTGVGFLGAGTILKEGATVTGLTTAASVWTVACLGIAAGFGYYAVALVGMVLMLITLTILELLQNNLPGRAPEMERYEIHTRDIAATLGLIDALAKDFHGNIRETLAERTERGHIIRFQATFPGIHSRRRSEAFFSTLASRRECESLNRDCTKV